MSSNSSKYHVDQGDLFFFRQSAGRVRMTKGEGEEVTSKEELRTEREIPSLLTVSQGLSLSGKGGRGNQEQKSMVERELTGSSNHQILTSISSGLCAALNSSWTDGAPYLA